MSTPAEAPGGEVLVYEASDGEIRVDVRLDHETVWLNREQMGELFGRERSVITKHVRNVFREGELEPEATCAKFAQVQTEGERTVTRDIDHYNLDVIISVGYRVKSSQGTRFRQWATRVLREHLVQGYTFNQARLAERGLLEARQTLDLLASTLRNQALVDDIRPTSRKRRRKRCWSKRKRSARNGRWRKVDIRGIETDILRMLVEVTGSTFIAPGHGCGETLTFVNKCLHFATCQRPIPPTAFFASPAGGARSRGKKSPKPVFIPTR